jgi:hypothetical protein
MSKPVRVELKSGVYYLDGTLSLGPDDSGVTWAAEKGGMVTLSGGRLVTGWRKTEDAAWVADVPWVRESGRGFRQLVVNGSCRPRCRTPNTGFYEVLPDPIPKGKPYVVHGNCPRLKYKSGDVDPAWKNPQTGEEIVYHYWTDSHMPIARVNAESNTLEFATPAKKTCTAIIGKDAPWYRIENARETLDEPGEWFLDVKTGAFYYSPKPGEDLTCAVVAAWLDMGLSRQRRAGQRRQ